VVVVVVVGEKLEMIKKMSRTHVQIIVRVFCGECMLKKKNIPEAPTTCLYATLGLFLGFSLCPFVKMTLVMNKGRKKNIPEAQTVCLYTPFGLFFGLVVVFLR
jgi:hypothetical protein